MICKLRYRINLYLITVSCLINIVFTFQLINKIKSIFYNKKLKRVINTKIKVMLSKIIKENFQEYINQHFFIEIKPNWTVGSPLYHYCSSTSYSIVSLVKLYLTPFWEVWLNVWRVIAVTSLKLSLCSKHYISMRWHACECIKEEVVALTYQRGSSLEHTHSRHLLTRVRHN